MDSRQIERKLTSLRAKLTAEVAEAKLLAARKKELQDEVQRLADEAETYAQVSALLASIGEERQFEVQREIEGIVTQGLQAIFEENLSFHMMQSVKANIPQVDFKVRTTFADGKVLETGVMNARGGGLSSTIGILLRIVIKLLGPDKDSPLILDEIGRMISEEYIDNFVSFLRQIVDKTPLQVILVSHQKVFLAVADYAYELSQDKDGATKVKDITQDA